jgi:hypothetical protein
MIQRLLLLLMLLCGLSCCRTFNTGAKLDSIGKAVPTEASHDGQVYRLNGTLYKEIMVEYVQQRPKLVGYVCCHDIDTFNEPVPAENVPAPELYLASLGEETTYVRAIDFPYTQAERVEQNTYLPYAAFQRADLLTLTPSMYEAERVLNDLPTRRTLGNKLRLPLSVVLTYGVDLPLTATSYVIGGVVQLILMPFGVAI